MRCRRFAAEVLHKPSVDEFLGGFLYGDTFQTSVVLEKDVLRNGIADLQTRVNRAAATEHLAGGPPLAVLEVGVREAATRSVSDVDISHRRLLLAANLLRSTY